MRKLLFALGLVCLMLTNTWAGQINKTLYFEQPEVTNVGDYNIIIESGCLTISNPGEPMLPRYSLSILLPAGEEAVSVEYISVERVKLDGTYNIKPADRQYPIGYAGPFETTEPIADIYESGGKYPQQPEQGLTTQFYRGHGIAFLNICPVEYYPLSGELYYYSQLEIKIITESTFKAGDAYRNFLRTDDQTNERLTSYIQNTADINMLYGQTSLDVDDEGNYDLLIITDDALQSSFEVLAEMKNRTGFLTEIMLVSDITFQYTGDDEQEQIRNCIIDQYQNHGIEYVLLGGDIENVPHRGLFDDAGGYMDEYDIPADIYYGNLDGTWNDDGDNLWGEEDEADLAGEVYVGRMAVDTETEAANFINKSIMYQMQPVIEDANNDLMVGEDLGWDVWGRAYKEEIRLGSDSWGYETVGLPRYAFDHDTLYDYSGEWNALSDLVPKLNSGVNLVNHLGHANVTYMLKLDNSSIIDNIITNDGVTHGYYLIYSQGCYCGAFDNRNSYGSYGDDCVSEEWTTIENGAVAMVTNSRYGWGDTDSTNGSSQYYDRQFFDAIFGENITRVGETQNDAKLDNISFISYEQNRWCHYCSNLFGDPTLDLWTGIPDGLVADHDGALLIGAENFTVALSDSTNDPIVGARVALSSEGTCWGRGITDEYGIVTIDIIGEITEAGEMDLVAIAHDFLPYETTLQVIPPEGPYLAFEDYAVDDEASGNNDGIPDYGETIELMLTLENIGTETAENVYAEISSVSQYVEIIDNTASFGDLTSGEIGECEDSYMIELLPNCPDQHNISFEIEAHAENYEETWTQTINFIVYAPITSLVSCSIDDALYGDGDGIIDAGETINLNPIIYNSGSSELVDFDGHVFTNDSYITITAGDASGGGIAPGEQDSLNSAFTMSIDEDCPLPREVSFTLSLDALNGYFNSMTFDLIIGGFTENFENGENGWTHSVVLNDFLDEWHMSTLRNHTETGEYSWKCGDEGSDDYSNYLDAALYMPAFDVTESNVLKYWQWLDAEYSNSYPGYCYDGGILEISIDEGETWNQIFPVGGYNYFIRTGGDPGPFEAETEVFSGVANWNEVSFNLSEFANETAQIRFRFGSDGAITCEGWYVDDIKITAENLYPSPGYLEVAIDDTYQAVLNWSAPESGTPDGYNIYRSNNPSEYDGEPINSSPTTELTYIDTEYITTLPNYYVITAAYTDGESNYSNEACLPAIVTGIDDEASALPEVFELMQNYPNPFNPRTNIKFNLPEPSSVTLEIYDILGRRVETLIDREMPAGYHSVTWDGSAYATGMYFYKLNAGEFTQSRKMVMVK